MVPEKVRQIVVVGDLHLHFWPAFSKGKGPQNSRFLKTLENLELSLKKAKELNCPWIQAGDWVHTIGFTHNPVLTYLIDTLNRYPSVEKYTVWGNHDARSAGSAIDFDETVVAVLERSVEGLTVLGGGHGIRSTRNGLRIYGEGYNPDPTKLHWLQTWPKDTPLVDVGVFHQTVAGSMLPSGVRMDHGLDGKELLRQFRFSIVGDIHEPQHFGRSGYGPDGPVSRLIMVPGSLEPHNFGDKSDRGWWVVSLGDNEQPVTWEFRKCTSPSFLTVETAKEVKDDGNFYRVTTPTDPKELPPGAVALSAAPTVVGHRSALKSVSTAHEVLSVWLQLNPPGVGSDGTVSADYLKAGRQLLEAEGSTAIGSERLRSVQLTNFLCYSSAVFRIQDGITLVSGEGRDYSSNGAGKTTLFEAIFWALFGRTTKGMDAGEVIQRGQKECTVAVWFDSGLCVERTRKGDLSTLRVGLEGGQVWGGTQKEVSEALRKYLGLTPELFQALTYFSQSKLVLFSQATDSERKAMISDLCGLDVYQKAATNAKTQAVVCGQEIAKISATIGVFEQGLQEARHQLQVAAKKSDDWVERAKTVRDQTRQEMDITRRNILDLEMKWSKVEMSIDVWKIARSGSIEESRPEITERIHKREEQSLVAIQNDFSKWKASLPEFPPGREMESRLKQLEAGLNTALEYQRKAIQATSQHQAELSQILKEIEKWVAVRDKCPTCGAAMDTTERDRQLDRLREQKAFLYDRLEESKKAEEKFKVEISTANDQIPLLRSLIELRKSSEEKIRSETLRIVQHESHLKELVEHRVNSELTHLHQFLDQKALVRKRKFEGRVQSRLGSLREKISRSEQVLASTEVDPHQAEILEASRKVSEKEATISNLKESQQAECSKEKIFRYWGHALSRSGVQSLLMEDVAAAFNNIRAQVFPILTNGIYDVQFSTTSTTAAGEDREKTDFIIRDRDALVSYESLSGGQRRRIDLGVMLTLALSVARTRNIPGVLGLLVLDEVFGFLDEDGVESLYEVLLEVNKVIPSIYAVTHNPALKSLFNKSLLVKQDEYGVSSLVN